MTLLGITGGIGAGKSTCAALLQERGVPVIDTDDVAREVVEPGQPALAEVGEAFGPGVFLPDGRLDRPRLGERVFADPAARGCLEAILHPRIRQQWMGKVADWRAEGRSLGAVVIPLLFETAAESAFDAVIALGCSAAEQARRLRERGWSPEHVRRRLDAQWPLARKLERSTYVIWTDGPRDLHGLQLDRILGRCVALPARPA